VDGDNMVDNTADYWIMSADYDIETARAMLKTGRYLYVGFMCQQTIEKALKAIIARDCVEGELPPKIHNLLKLSQIADLYKLMSEKQISLIDGLNPLNIEGRYPEYKQLIAKTIPKNNATKLINETEDLLCWIKARL
jgi:HEPN domain-containing protein